MTEYKINDKINIGIEGHTIEGVVTDIVFPFNYTIHITSSDYRGFVVGNDYLINFIYLKKVE